MRGDLLVVPNIRGTRPLNRKGKEREDNVTAGGLKVRDHVVLCQSSEPLTQYNGAYAVYCELS